MRITYYATKPVQVGDEVRQPGDLVPEANEWAYVEGYIRDGRIAPVLVATLPKRAQEELARWEEEQRSYRIALLESQQQPDPEPEPQQVDENEQDPAEESETEEVSG